MAASYTSCFSLNVLFVGLIGLLLAAAHLPLHVLCTASFSMELMHRDHPESPLYDPSSTASGADYLHSAEFRSPNSPLIIDNPKMPLESLGSAFVVRAAIGSRNKHIQLLFSSSNGLPCLQCFPCTYCYKSNLPTFNSKLSTSYLPHNCESDECRMVNGKCDRENNCQYTEKLILPIDGLVASTIARDTMQIVNQVDRIFLNITFGCIYRTEGNFHRGSIGLMGLGPGPLSFVSQLGRHSYERMFSYCLPALVGRSSILFFGRPAYNIPGPYPFVRTPLDVSTNVYRVTVESILIEGADYQPIMTSSPNQYAIDPNTRYTHVSKKALNQIIEAVKSRTHFPTIPRDRINTIHELCFDISSGRNDDKMAKITLKMADGAQYGLMAENAYEIVEGHAMCLTILSTELSGGKSTIGSLAQLNKRIVIDITRRRLSFRTDNCT